MLLLFFGAILHAQESLWLVARIRQRISDTRLLLSFSCSLLGKQRAARSQVPFGSIWNQIPVNQFAKMQTRGNAMTRMELYRHYAAECIRIAQEVSDPAHRVTLIEMAQLWRNLLDRMEKETKT